MSDSRALIVPAELREGLVMQTYVDFQMMLADDPNAPRVLTNLNKSLPDYETLVFAAVAPPVFQFEEQVGKVFLLKAFYCHKIEITSREGGEIMDCIRTVLINDQGETLGVISRGITDSLGVLMGLRGYGPWEPPIPVLLREGRTNNKRRVYGFAIAPRKDVLDVKSTKSKA